MANCLKQGLSMRTLKNKTVFITGGTRGIGKAIALRAARDGANIIIAAKSDKPLANLPGTIFSVAEEVEQAGGQALPVKLDVRNDDAILDAVSQAVGHFGGLDILVNNASAITLQNTLDLPMKRFDLMHSVNVRGTYACSKACLPHLLKSDNPHILNLSPPLNLEPAWFRDHVGYTLSKYGMSMCVLGMAAEFRSRGVAVNALWPRTVIHTSAINMLGDVVKPENCRRPEIVADAAHVILCRDSKTTTGNFYLDEDVLRTTGVRDFDQYAVNAGKPLMKDLFLN
jgi:citronellol/citronellal dehydrogenase